jgi:homospermidine synthase
MSDRSNYAMREAIFDLRRSGHVRTRTTMSCVGANPGLISWLLKDALLELASALGHKLAAPPSSQREWAQLMRDLGVQVRYHSALFAR